MLKNKATGFYAGCISALLGAIAMGLYFSNISNAYFADSASAVVVGCSLAAIAMMVVYVVGEKYSQSNAVAEFCRGLMSVAAVFCLFTALMQFLSTRVYNMAIIYGSSLEANNESAHSAMAQALVVLALYLIAGIAAIIASFSGVEKELA